MSASTHRIVFSVSTSTENPPRTAAALVQVLAAHQAGADVALWFWHEGVRMAVKGVAETFREPLEPTPTEVLDALAKAKVPITVHTPCLVRREFQDNALRANCKSADGQTWQRYIKDGYVPVSL